MNELLILFNKRQVQATPDRRYRIMITLIRSDRPMHANFLCMNCGHKIGEIVNRTIVSVNDFYAVDTTEVSGMTRHCKGEDPESGRGCPYSYFFNFQ